MGSCQCLPKKKEPVKGAGATVEAYSPSTSGATKAGSDANQPESEGELQRGNKLRTSERERAKVGAPSATEVATDFEYLRTAPHPVSAHPAGEERAVDCGPEIRVHESADESGQPAKTGLSKFIRKSSNSRESLDRQASAPLESAQEATDGPHPIFKMQIRQGISDEYLGGEPMEQPKAFPFAHKLNQAVAQEETGPPTGGLGSKAPTLATKTSGEFASNGHEPNLAVQRTQSGGYADNASPTRIDIGRPGALGDFSEPLSPVGYTVHEPSTPDFDEYDNIQGSPGRTRVDITAGDYYTGEPLEDDAKGAYLYERIIDTTAPGHPIIEAPQFSPPPPPVEDEADAAEVIAGRHVRAGLSEHFDEHQSAVPSSDRYGNEADKGVYGQIAVEETQRYATVDEYRETPKTYNGAPQFMPEHQHPEAGNLRRGDESWATPGDKQAGQRGQQFKEQRRHEDYLPSGYQEAPKPFGLGGRMGVPAAGVYGQNTGGNRGRLDSDEWRGLAAQAGLLEETTDGRPRSHGHHDDRHFGKQDGIPAGYPDANHQIKSRDYDTVETVNNSFGHRQPQQQIDHGFSTDSLPRFTPSESYANSTLDLRYVQSPTDEGPDPYDAYRSRCPRPYAGKDRSSSAASSQRAGEAGSKDASLAAYLTREPHPATKKALEMRLLGPYCPEVRGMEASPKKTVVSTRQVTSTVYAPFGEIEVYVDQQYKPGDYVFIRPQNSPEAVQQLAELYRLPERVLNQNITFVEGGREEQLPTFRFALPIKLRDAFAEEIDLTGPPTLSLMKAIQAERKLPPELANKLQSNDYFIAWIREAKPTLLEVLQHFDELPSVECLLIHAPLIQPRCYLAASEIDGRLSVCFNVLKVTNERYGFCSEFLYKLKAGDHITASVHPGRGVALPERTNAPIIMIAGYTGIAPFRGFLEAAKKNILSGKLYLLYEFRKSAEAPYLRTISSYEEYGIITDLLLVPVGQPNQEGAALAGRIEKSERWQSVFNQLVHEAGQELRTQIYVCGSTPFCVAIRAAMETILGEGVTASPRYHEERLLVGAQRSLEDPDFRSIPIRLDRYPVRRLGEPSPKASLAPSQTATLHRTAEVPLQDVAETPSRLSATRQERQQHTAAPPVSTTTLYEREVKHSSRDVDYDSDRYQPVKSSRDSFRTADLRDKKNAYGSFYHDNSITNGESHGKTVEGERTAHSTASQLGEPAATTRTSGGYAIVSATYTEPGAFAAAHRLNRDETPIQRRPHETTRDEPEVHLRETQRPEEYNESGAFAAVNRLDREERSINPYSAESAHREHEVRIRDAYRTEEYNEPGAFAAAHRLSTEDKTRREHPTFYAFDSDKSRGSQAGRNSGEQQPHQRNVSAEIHHQNRPAAASDDHIQTVRPETSAFSGTYRHELPLSGGGPAASAGAYEPAGTSCHAPTPASQQQRPPSAASATSSQRSIAQTKLPIKIRNVHGSNVAAEKQSAVVLTIKLLAAARDEDVHEIAMFFDVPYEPGDHVTIRPQNLPFQVYELSQIYGIHRLDEFFAIEHASGAHKIEVPVTYRAMFAEELDLSAPPSIELLRAVQQEVGQLPQILANASSSENSYHGWVSSVKPNIFTVLGLLEESGSALPSLELLISCLHRIRPRKFVITSVTEGIITFNYRAIRIDNDRCGLATTYLANVRPRDHVTVNVIKGGIQLPIRSSTPIVFVASEFGVTALRAFWEARRKLKIGGRLVLLYEVKRGNMVLYWTEIMMRKLEGVFSDTMLTYSDDIKIADQLAANYKWRKLICQLIEESGGHVVVAGPRSFCERMRNTFSRMFGVGPELRAQPWYHEDASCYDIQSTP